ncbi:hypothetical protein MRX96_000972 [Rhipicephalus microplus]
MAAFERILYAQSTEELQAAKESLRGLCHAQHSQRVKAFLQCEQQWVLLHRVDLMARGHNANNYSEASIRILKDIVLSRNKAYNAVALVEYIMTKWEEYFKLRLLHHAHHRDPYHQIRFQYLLEKMPDVPSECIVLLGNAMYSVPSSSGFGSYELDASIGLCSCWRGNQDAFCKHQAFVRKAFGGAFPNSPVLTLEDCLSLGQLAAGDRCPSLEYFVPISQQDPIPSPAPQEPVHPNEVDMEYGLSCTEVATAPLAPLRMQSLSAEERADVQEKFLVELRRIASLSTGSSSSDQLLRDAVSNLKKINTRSGRPRKVAGQQKVKRCHKLSRNVQDNVPVAKCH